LENTKKDAQTASDEIEKLKEEIHNLNEEIIKLKKIKEENKKNISKIYKMS
jgi:predicted  nucleic acid-binding Zn-ribbon protein